MNTIATSLVAPRWTGESTAKAAPPVEQPVAADTVRLGTQKVAIAQPQSLLATAPAPAAPNAPVIQEDREWSGLGKAAAITAGVVGGVVLGAVVAQAAGIGGMQLGSIVMNSLYLEALPKAVGLTGLLGVTDKVLLAAPVLGGIAGGIVGGIAGQKKGVQELSDVPGSALAQNPNVGKLGISGLPRWTWGAVKTSMRDAGESVHDGVNGIGDAKSFGEAVSAGASGAYAFGSRMGNVAGKVTGLVQGAYLGALLAGMPFAFAPLTAIPIAIVGAWGISAAMSTVGGIAAGAITGAGGAVVGAVGYGVKKLVASVQGEEQPAEPPAPVPAPAQPSQPAQPSVPAQP